MYRLLIVALVMVALIISTAQTATKAKLSTANATVTIQGFNYIPATLTIKPGQTVTWVNKDTAPHTATADDGKWDSGRLAQGKSYSRKFTQAGTYKYHCSIHPRMKGTIIVKNG